MRADAITGETGMRRVLVLDRTSVLSVAKEMRAWGRHYNQAVHALNVIAKYLRSGWRVDEDEVADLLVSVKVKLDDVEHAYAITVHKSQGSEYGVVIIPMCSASPMLLTRNLLYTAVTRAKKMAILVGREEILGRMIENDRQSMRYTGLAQRLAGDEK